MTMSNTIQHLCGSVKGFAGPQSSGSSSSQHYLRVVKIDVQCSEWAGEGHVSPRQSAQPLGGIGLSGVVCVC